MDAGGRVGAMAVVGSVVGMGVSGADVIAERLIGVGDVMVLICVVGELDIVGDSSNAWQRSVVLRSNALALVGVGQF